MTDTQEAIVISTSEARDAAMAMARPDPRQPATASDKRVMEVSEALAPAYAKASTLELTDEEVAALMAPFPDNAVDIRPHDGLIFLSHIHISDRLNTVLKPGKWALVCRRHWLEAQTLYGEYILLIRGCFVGESVGGHLYQPNNPKTNYSDSLESTAAEALRRIAGKRLSCGSQVWHKDYAERWVATYAEQAQGKWRKKAIPSAALLAGNAPKPTEAPKTPQAVKTPAIQLTPEERKAALIVKCKGMEQEATQVFREEGLVLPTEDLTDIGLTTIERMSPDNMLALVKQVRQRRLDNEQVPGAEVPAHEAEGIVGPVEEVSIKQGQTKAGKAYVKYGVKLAGVWHNTFSQTLYDAARGLKGQEVRYTATQTQYGWDLNTLEPTAEVLP